MLSSSFVDESTILTDLATSPVLHENTDLTLIIRSINGDSRTCVKSYLLPSLYKYQLGNL